MSKVHTVTGPVKNHIGGGAGVAGAAENTVCLLLFPSKWNRNDEILYLFESLKIKFHIRVWVEFRKTPSIHNFTYNTVYRVIHATYEEIL